MRRDKSGWRRHLRKGRHAAFFTLGLAMLLMGFIGAFLPIMPTTIFLIIAAWCFGRSSPRLERWMLNHPRFGPALRAWRDQGAVPRRAKWMAAIGMTAGYLIFMIGTKPGPILAAFVALALLGCAAYVISRPEPTNPDE